MKRSRNSGRRVAGVLRRLILPGVVLLLWRLAAQASTTGVVFPSIPDVLHVVRAPFEKPPFLDAPSLYFSSVTSLLRVLLGFALATAYGVPIGLMMGRSRAAQEVFSPAVTAVRVICPLAWMPLAIVLFGVDSLATLLFGEAEGWRYVTLDEIQPAMIVVTGLAAFAPIVLASAHAARALRENLVEAAWLMGASPRRIFVDVVVPHCLPTVLNGMRIGLGFAWMVIVAAELLPGTRSGLGFTIWVSHDAAVYEYTFAAMIYIGLIGLALNGILLLLEKRVGHWQAVQR